MKTGVTTSVIAHAALLIIALVGLGSAKPLEPEVVESIAVDLVPISDITNIRLGSLDSTVVETETPALVKTDKPAEIAKPAGNTEEDQVTPEETPKPTPAPVVNAAPEPAPSPVPDPAPEPTPVEQAALTPTPDPAPEPAPAEAQKEVVAEVADAPPAEQVAPMPAMRPAQLQATPAKEKPKPVEKPKTPIKVASKEDTAKSKTDPDPEARKADAISQILNSEKSRGSETGDGGTPTLGKNTGRSATLSQTQIDGLIAQIKNCPYYNPPIGAADAGATAQLRFSIDGGGNVGVMPEIVSAGASQMERALASAAQRGVMRCGPYAMAVNQDVQATFDPRLM